MLSNKYAHLGFEFLLSFIHFSNTESIQRSRFSEPLEEFRRIDLLIFIDEPRTYPNPLFTQNTASEDGQQRYRLVLPSDATKRFRSCRADMPIFVIGQCF